MKTILFLALSFFLLFNARPVQAQDFTNAGEYMSYLGKQQEDISKKFMSYASASAHGKKARKVENLRNKLLNEVQDAKMNVSGMPSFKGDKSYRDTTVSFLKIYYNVLNEDYSKIINLEDVAEQSYDEMEAYILLKELVDKKLEDENERMKTAQQKFAAQNNITLLEDKSDLGNMMKEVGDMNEYYNVLYLIFFKPYVQEKNLMADVEKGNITGLEQDKNSLQKYAKEGLDKLPSLKGYKGDNNLLTACRNILNFYLTEADKMKTTSDYFLTVERFNGIKKDYEKKSDPTKQDVGTYNDAVKEVNKITKEYNTNNNNLNKMRNDALKDWNDAVNSFFDEHTPRYK